MYYVYDLKGKDDSEKCRKKKTKMEKQICSCLCNKEDETVTLFVWKMKYFFSEIESLISVLNFKGYI